MQAKIRDALLCAIRYAIRPPRKSYFASIVRVGFAGVDPVLILHNRKASFSVMHFNLEAQIRQLCAQTRLLRNPLLMNEFCNKVAR